jgi:XTP/dITP diphosphohydrolase
MIFDHISHPYRYSCPQLPQLSLAFDWISKQSFSTLPDGQYAILGEEVFAILSSYETKAGELGKWEAHRRYADLQYMVEGSELMGYAPLSIMEEITEYNEENDFALFDGPGEFLHFQEGMYAVFMPEDVHMPGIELEEKETVRKLVIKIEIKSVQTLSLASGNVHKAKEFEGILGDTWRIATAAECGFKGTFTESGNSLEANAREKAETLYAFCGNPVLADDSGLFVEHLDGKPGVFSARFAGEEATDQQNRQKLLSELRGVGNRNAYFKTVLCYKASDSGIVEVSGIVHGTLLEEERGLNGFGYDSLFVPNGFNKTFAELPLAVKQQISHRAIATRNLIMALDE